MSQAFVLCSLVVVSVGFANGLYIRKQIDGGQEVKDNGDIKFRSILNSWNEYKNKIISEINVVDSNNFNEMEVLEMIPLIIGQYRLKQINEQDQDILSQVYGSLWPIIVQEATRDHKDALNPMLETILQAFRVGSHVPNDVTLDQNLNLNVNTRDHPSQRVLKTAAKLIHHNPGSSARTAGNDRSPVTIVRHSSARGDTFDLKLTNIPINLISRSRRNVEIRVHGGDMSSDKIDSLLKMYRQRHGLEAQESDDEYEENEVVDGVPEFEPVANMSPKDYLYDNYEDDEEAAGPPEKTNLGAEYGSFQDLILLAAKNRLRREHEETRLKPKNSHFI